MFAIARRYARVFAHHCFGALAHLAGRKAVAESVRDPLLYYAEFWRYRPAVRGHRGVWGAPTAVQFVCHRARHSLDGMMADVWRWQQRQGDEELRCHE